MRLSKSKFIAGLQCLKRLYLEVHQPELAGEPDEQTLAVFEPGQEVGRWVQKAFPGGSQRSACFAGSAAFRPA